MKIALRFHLRNSPLERGLNKDVSVRVLLCSDAGKLALKNSESPVFAPSGRSPKQLLMGLIDRDVQVEVCGIFLPNRDYTVNIVVDRMIHGNHVNQLGKLISFH